MLLRNTEPYFSPPKKDGQLSIWSILRRMAVCFAIGRIILRRWRCRVSIVVRHVRARISTTMDLFIEYESIRTIVDAEITKIIEARKRSCHEEAYRRRRNDVKQHYNCLNPLERRKFYPTSPNFDDCRSSMSFNRKHLRPQMSLVICKNPSWLLNCSRMT